MTSTPAPDPAGDGALLADLDAVFDHAAHASHRIRDLLLGFLAARPTGGVHHLTFKVADIRAALRRVEELGLTATGVNFENPNWQEFFVHPRQGFGALIQLAQPGSVPWGRPGLTLDDVLVGRGRNGDGRPSP